MSVRVSSLECVKDAALATEMVGSRVTCSPKPQDTDIDVLVLVADCRKIARILLGYGFDFDGSRPDDKVAIDEASKFESYSNGIYNFIITESRPFFDKFMAATSVAKRLNLLDKSDRVALFQAVLYGNPCTQKETSL